MADADDTPPHGPPGADGPAPSSGGLIRLPGAPVPPRLVRWLAALRTADGSDLLLTDGAPPLIRVDGDLRAIEGEAPLDSDAIDEVLAELLTDEQAGALARWRQVDLSFSWAGLRLRGNAFVQRGRHAFAVRAIPVEVPTLQAIGAPAVLASLAERRQGLVLVTGASGAGKSTTLAAMIDHINRTRACHILTLEDPIEYVHHHQRSAVSQREVGVDVGDFVAGLHAALREDPDVLLVGEVRDPETIQALLTLAETGHLVLATLHANDTAQAVDRIVDVVPSGRQEQVRVQLAATLAGVVHQQLVPRIGGGRVAAHEVLLGTTAVRNLIRQGRSEQLRNQLLGGRELGMQSMERALSELVAAGLVSLEEARSRSAAPHEVLAPAAPAPASSRRR